MYPGTVAAFTWPDAAALLGVLLAVMFLIGAPMAFYIELRKAKLREAQDEDLRQLVRRYEQLAETTLDAQQRVAADMSELRSRTTSIEKILRTVDGG
jgi:Tfp pilus assembly protein PilO